MFEKLSLFVFKNCKNVLFTSKLLAKLLVKMPLKHSSIFAGSCFSQDNHETLYINFNVFLFLPSSFSREELTRNLLAKMPLKEFFDKNKK